MSLRRPHQGVIAQFIPGFYPEDMAAVSVGWSNGATGVWTPGGLYNNSTDGSSLVVWHAEFQIAPPVTPPAGYLPSIDFTYADRPVGAGGLGFTGAGAAHSNTLVTSLDIPVPSSAVSGTYLVMLVGWNNFVDPVITPSGFTVITRGGVAAFAAAMLLGKVGTDNEPASYNLAFSSGERVMGAIASYAGVDLPHTLDAYANNGGQNSPMQAPALTTVVPGCMAIAGYGHNDAGIGITTPPPAMTVRANEGVGLLCDRLLSGTTIAAQNAVLSADDRWGAGMITLRPAQRGYTLTPSTPLLATEGSAFGQGIVIAQGAAELGQFYYTAVCQNSLAGTNSGYWKWDKHWPFAILPPGKALLANLTTQTSAQLSFIYEVTKVY
jgi:hypothetical protein